MQRNKKLIYVSHCVLNQNSVIAGWERSESSFKRVIQLILDKDISIIQLPCPELKALGLSRPPKTKEAYDYKEYRNLCDSLSESVISEMKVYLENDYQIIGLIGIEESPTCDTNRNRGIFMEELYHKLKENNINLPSLDIPEDYNESMKLFNQERWIKFLRK